MDIENKRNPAPKILVVDDEQPFLESIRIGLQTVGYTNLHLESDPRNVAALLETGVHFDIAFLDITMPHIDGVALLQYIKQVSPSTECLMLSAHDKAKLAVDCVRKGAYDYLTKPISLDEIIPCLERALERKRLLELVHLKKGYTPKGVTNPEVFKSIVTESTTFRQILAEAELHAASNIPVLITGESGTGKELLAKAIHRSSPRASQPFSAINMASMSSTLFDAEFFGHTKGAFTGAERNRAGYLEHTNKGTLFLDEIGHLPADLQGKLLRVLQEGEYLKLGSNTPNKTNVRFVAATNVDLEKLVEKGEFRLDLYYRLKCAWLHLPPLRERKEDIPLLINHFLTDSEVGEDTYYVDAEVVEILQGYNYPGNVRELQSIVQSAVNLSQGSCIVASSLPSTLTQRKAIPISRGGVQDAFTDQTLEEVTTKHIKKVYDQTGMNKSQAAKILGIGLSTLRRKLGAYNID